MKTLLKFSFALFTILSCCFLALNSYSQGNLQFNQVLLISTSQTVPVGKVWKIETTLDSAKCNGSMSKQSYWLNAVNDNNLEKAHSLEKYIKINGTEVVVFGSTSFIDGSSYTGEYAAFSFSAEAEIAHSIFPMWIPEGTTVEAGEGVLYVNVVEFNVVQ